MRQLPDRPDLTSLQIAGAVGAVYGLGLLVPALLQTLTPPRVEVCADPPCILPGRDWTQILSDLVGGGLLVAGGAVLAVQAPRRPRLTRPLALVLAAGAVALAVLATVPLVETIGATWRAGEPAAGPLPTLSAPRNAGAGAALALLLIVALLLSLHVPPRALRRPRPIAVAEVIVLALGVTWAGSAVAAALRAMQLNPIDWEVTRDSDPPETELFWVLEARAAALDTILVLLATVTAGLLVLARLRARRRLMAIAAGAQALLLVATILPTVGVASGVLWTGLDRVPSGLGALGLVLSLVLTVRALRAGALDDDTAPTEPLPPPPGADGGPAGTGAADGPAGRPSGEAPDSWYGDGFAEADPGPGPAEARAPEVTDPDATRVRARPPGSPVEEGAGPTSPPPRQRD